MGSCNNRDNSDIDDECKKKKINKKNTFYSNFL